MSKDGTKLQSSADLSKANSRFRWRSFPPCSSMFGRPGSRTLVLCWTILARRANDASNRPEPSGPRSRSARCWGCCTRLSARAKATSTSSRQPRCKRKTARVWGYGNGCALNSERSELLRETPNSSERSELLREIPNSFERSEFLREMAFGNFLLFFAHRVQNAMLRIDYMTHLRASSKDYLKPNTCEVTRTSKFVWILNIARTASGSRDDESATRSYYRQQCLYCLITTNVLSCLSEQPTSLDVFDVFLTFVVLNLSETLLSLSLRDFEQKQTKIVHCHTSCQLTFRRFESVTTLLDSCNGRNYRSASSLRKQRTTTVKKQSGTQPTIPRPRSAPSSPCAGCHACVPAARQDGWPVTAAKRESRVKLYIGLLRRNKLFWTSQSGQELA